MSCFPSRRASQRLILSAAVASLSVAAAHAAVVPEPPRAYVDTSYPSPAGAVITVPAGGDLQAALDAAQPGDVVALQAGATFAGPFTLPAKSGTGWIVVRTSTPDGSLPRAGTRITPADAPLLPKLVSTGPGPALRTAPEAHHYRIVGVEFSVAAGVSQNYGLVLLGDGSSAQSQLADVPHHLVLDRVYIHGDPGVNLRRGVGLNSAWSAVVDSHISDVHETGADSQAIAGWNGPGPFKIVNNYLEAAGENVLFGGADPSISDLVPSDLEVRGNHLFKPLSWKSGDPSFAGTAWSVKNLFELKNARRVLVEGNVFENNWLHSQNGFAILFTVRNQDGGAPWSVVEDVTFRLNVVRHTGSAVNILGKDNLQLSEQTRRLLIQDNLFEDVDGATWGGSGRLFQLLSGSLDVAIDHNTAFHTGDVIMASGDAHLGFTYTNNLTPHNLYGVAGDGTFGDPLLTLATYFPNALFVRDVLMGGSATQYPLDNFFPATWADVGFVDLAGGDYRLSSGSPYQASGTDGEDLGADIEALLAATAGAVGGSGSAPPPDETPPAISGVSVSSITDSGATVAWLTDEASDSQVEYGPTTAYGSSTPLDGALVTSHAQILTGLQPATSYHYRVHSRDAAGNLAVSADHTFTTLAASDDTPPDVSLTAPDAGGSVSGVVAAEASASDDTGVAGVQFLADGATIGAEDTTAPYSASWDTAGVGDGDHTLTAVARDAAGNTGSVSITVTVANGVASDGSGVTWTALVDVTATGSELQKTGGCDGCQDAGAVSVEQVASGDAALELTATETTSQRVIGLSSGNSDTTSADIDFALLFWPGGTADVRENGAYQNAETSYAPGDVFRITVESGSIHYYKNGARFYTSAQVPAYPLQVDTSFLTLGGTLGPVTLSGEQSPYHGQPSPVPGRFEAEDFDRGGEGVAYHELTAGNAGGLYRTGEDVDIVSPYTDGYVVNGFQAGEWLEYAVDVAESGVYRLEVLVSSEFSDARFHVEVDGVDVTGPLVAPDTGSWRTFQWTGAGGVSLASGTHLVRLHSEAEYFNVDALRIATDESLPPPDDEPSPAGITWTEMVNVTASDGVLQKTGGCDGCQDAGAVSVEAIEYGDGALEVTVAETDTHRVIGLSRGNSDDTRADVDFAVQFWPGGGADVREGGTYRNAETSYAAGDVFRIAVESGTVRYYRNGVLFYTSEVAPAYPLQVDTSFFTLGATLQGVVLETAQ